MFTAQYSKTTTATREQIWQIWSDVENWKNWDKELASSKLFGQLKSGAKGEVVTTGGQKSTFEVTDCKENEVLADVSRLPLCEMRLIHTLSDTKDGLEVTHKVTMTGPLTFLYVQLFGKKVAQGLPDAVNSLVALAEK
jgi:uncharacterized membrane protein